MVCDVTPAGLELDKKISNCLAGITSRDYRVTRILIRVRRPGYTLPV